MHDDLERATCNEAGQLGHMHCGICEGHDVPRFMCGCFSLAPQPPIPYGANLRAEVINVCYAELERFGESNYKVHCPVCRMGLLMVARSLKTHALLACDRCTRCGQRVRYLDQRIAGEPVEKETEAPW